MLGGNGERILSLALPHVDAWNTWYSPYGNTVAGFAEASDKVSTICARVGRDPRDVERSACVFVAVAGGEGERPHDVAPVGADTLAAHLQDLVDAGADEAILVVDPITERTVRTLASALGWTP